MANLVKCDISKIGNYYKKTCNLEILEEFVESGNDCVEVKNFRHKSACNCAASLNNSIERFHFEDIRAISRKGHCYLVKLNALK